MKSEMLWVIRGGFLKWQFVKDCCYFLMPAMVFIFVAVFSPPCAYLLCKLFSQISSSVKFFESSTARKTATGERRKQTFGLLARWESFMWKMSRATKSALQHCCAKSHGSKSREETEINAETRMELGNESCKRRKRRREHFMISFVL